MNVFFFFNQTFCNKSKLPEILDVAQLLVVVLNVLLAAVRQHQISNNFLINFVINDIK